MTTSQLLLSAWDWEPSIVIGCAGLLALYAWAVRVHFTRRGLYYLCGVLLILLVLVSPLDVLGDNYLFSAHMLQHLLLALGIPPLLIIGIPRPLAERIVSVPVIGRVERLLRRPAVSWTIGIGVMAFWHLPPFFNAALANEGLHAFQHVNFLVSGTIFWWPIVSPLASSRLSPVPWAAAYLFTACLACTVIGVLLTFSSAALYPAYLQPAGSAAAVSLIRDSWGISAEADHQWGGLLMWTLGCTEYLCATMAMFGRWYAEGAVPSPGAARAD
jgi:putative membrane protein